MLDPGENRGSAAGLRAPGAGNGPAGTGFTVSVAVRVTALKVAEMVTGAALETVSDETVNVALVAPAPTVTLAGTVAMAVLLLDSVTTAPPAGAALVSVTVPCEALPPVMLAGFNVRVDRLAGGGGGGTGFTVSVAVRVTPPKNAERVTVLVTDTPTVVTANVALVAPAATVTLARVEATP